MKKVVLFFGNELIPEDSAAIEAVKKIRNELEDVEFYHCTSPEELTLFLDYKKVVLLDVSKDVSDVTLLDDVSMLKRKRIISLHDFDLNFFLKILEKLGNVKYLKIVLVPPRLEKNFDKKLIKILRES